MSKKLLEVGDVVYKLSRYTMKAVESLTIDRITKTVAFSGKVQFKRELDGNIVKPRPASDFGNYTYRLPAPELTEKMNQEVLLHKVQNANLYTLSTDQLRRMVDIIQEKKEKEL